MALWAAKNMGVLFGGVTDEDTNEETLESVFHNDLYVVFLVTCSSVPCTHMKGAGMGISWPVGNGYRCS